MKKKFEDQTIHQKIVIIIEEMVEKELRLKDAIKEFEKVFIETALRKNKGNKSRAAEAIGLHRNTLRNRVNSLRIKK